MASIPIVNVRDNRIGILVSVLFMTLFGTVLYFINYTIADPPPEPYVQPVATELTAIEIKNLKLEPLSSSGNPNEDPLDKPQDQTEQIITVPTDSKVTTNSGSSNKNTKPNNTNTPTAVKNDVNPFGSGGKGDKGTAQGNGPIGSNDNISANPGGGGEAKAPDRKRLNNPQTNDIESDEDCYVSLQLTIDQDGNIVDVSIIGSGTTTNDQRIRNQVAMLVKSQVKYNKAPGAKLQVETLRVKVNAN